MRIGITKLLCIAIVFSACKKPTDVILPKKLIGINGEASYAIDPTTQSVVAVMKDEYTKSPDYMVQIQKDTLRYGDEFAGFINVFRPGYRISVRSPSAQEITGQSTTTVNEYRFTPDKLGIYSFSGIIEYDTATIPFEYKFIVVKGTD